jgi:hypothetical protein
VWLIFLAPSSHTGWTFTGSGTCLKRTSGRSARDYPEVGVLNGSRGGLSGITYPALSLAVRWLAEKNITSGRIVGDDIFVGATARDQHTLRTGHYHLAAARAHVRGGMWRFLI